MGRRGIWGKRQGIGGGASEAGAGLGWGLVYGVAVRLGGMSHREIGCGISELSDFLGPRRFLFSFLSVMNICIYWTVLYVMFTLRHRILQVGYKTLTSSSSHYPLQSDPIQAPNIPPPIEEVSQFHQVKSPPPSVSPTHPSLMRWRQTRSWVRWHQRHRRRR